MPEYAESTLVYSIKSILDLLSSHLSSPYAQALWVQDASSVLVRPVAQVGYHERPHTKLCCPTQLLNWQVYASGCLCSTSLTLLPACYLSKCVVLLVARPTKANPGGDLTAQTAAAEAAASAWCSTPNAVTLDTLIKVRAISAAGYPV